MIIKNQPSPGFSLIELVIVVAIVGILALVGYPSYTEHVRKTERKAAVGKILNIATSLEQYKTQNFAYPTDAAVQATLEETDNRYAYEIAVTDNAGKTSYSITATPVSTGPQASDRCGVLTYTSQGEWSFDNNLTETDCL